MRPAVPLALAVALGLPAVAGCGKSTIKPDGAQRSVADVVAGQTGFRPTDVHCPSGVEAKAGGTFDCTFTGPEPKPYVAHVEIRAVDGAKVRFFVRTEPSG